MPITSITLIEHLMMKIHLLPLTSVRSVDNAAAAKAAGQSGQVSQKFDLARFRTILNTSASSAHNFASQRPKIQKQDVSHQSLMLWVGIGNNDVTKATDDRPIVGTKSLLSCAGIAIYDMGNKVGGVAHVFFKEKTGHVFYIEGTQGREISSMGRAVVCDKPTWYEEFGWHLRGLIRKANEKGGKRYLFYAFNVQQGCRTKTQNERLTSYVEQEAQRLIADGVVSEFRWRDDRAFTLDTRTGILRRWNRIRN